MNNDDDFDEEGLDLGEDSFDDFEDEKKSNTLGDLWRNSSAFKIGVVVAAAIVIFGGIIFLGEEQQPVAPSVVGQGRGSEVTAAPGTQEVSPSYIEAIEEANEARIEEAVQTGQSALPTPIDPPVGRVVVPEESEAAEDPLQRWRRLQEERLARELQRTQTLRPEQSAAEAALIAEAETQRAEAVQALSSAMSEQMQVVLETRRDASISSIDITAPSFLDQLNPPLPENASVGPDGTIIEGEEESQEPRRLLANAGEIVYAQTLIEANSDIPGPVLAQILSGRMKGSRVLGDFQVQQEYLVLTFGTVVLGETTLGINAIALDPDTTLQGIVSYVDHRYFQRIVLPAAAAFVEGVADAIEESGTTTVTIEGETVAEESEETDTEQEVAAGVSEIGEELGDILDDMADVPILVVVEAGTPFAMLFLDQVFEQTENNDNNTQTQTTQAGQP